MAGHSKWSQIKRAKGAADAKRGQVFAKLAKEVMIAVKAGGSGDPALNPRLRMVILKCKSSNMPNDNVDRAIARASGEGDDAVYQELTYEIYGPNGVAILGIVNTDNRNRTAAEIRHILSKNNGTLATAGAVSRLFERKGQIIITRDQADEDVLMEVALEAGAEDFQADEEGYEIVTDPSGFEDVHSAIEAKGISCEVAHITQLPTMTAPVDAATGESIQKLIDALEENEDIQDVYTNAEFPD